MDEMSKAQEAIAEIDASLAEMAPRHEGLRDYAALNLHEATKALVEEEIRRYDTRTEKLHAARAAILDLVENGHPALDVREVDQAIYADLRENAATIEAALARFSPNTAATLGLSATPPEQK